MEEERRGEEAPLYYQRNNGARNQSPVSFMDGGYSPGQNTASTLQVAMNSENLASSRDSVNTSGFSKPHGHKYAMNKLSDNWFLERHRFIPVYIPNIIGYLRIICTTISIALAFTHPRSMLFFYFISFVFDELDGRFARLFSQQSTFGAVLDMVTDRLSTAALLCILGVLYPGMAQIFILLQALDIASHWCHMYASLLSGGTSHKELSNHHNWLVRSYYANRIFMGTCCVSCELLYLSIYALHWPMDFKDWSVPLGPAWASWASVVQGEGQREVSIFVLFALVAIPGFVIKNLVNVIQLVQSMKGLCEHDLKNM